MSNLSDKKIKLIPKFSTGERVQIKRNFKFLKGDIVEVCLFRRAYDAGDMVNAIGYGIGTSQGIRYATERQISTWKSNLETVKVKERERVKNLEGQTQIAEQS